jgi:hypothetical protein
MYISNVIDRFAERRASRIDGKIWSPFRSTAALLPPTSGGPRSAPIARVKCSSSTP